MDRKIHRRMMDARYYLENGVAHPFTTGSRAQRSFRLPRLFFLLLLLPLLSSFPFMSTPVFISPRSVSAPFQRERERERGRGRFRGSRSAGPRERMSPKAEESSTWRATSYVPAYACTWTKGKVQHKLCGHPRSKWNDTSISRREEE